MYQWGSKLVYMNSFFFKTEVLKQWDFLCLNPLSYITEKHTADLCCRGDFLRNLIQSTEKWKCK